MFSFLFILFLEEWGLLFGSDNIYVEHMHDIRHGYIRFVRIENVMSRILCSSIMWQ